MNLENCYETLEIPPSTRLKEVKHQVRRLLLKFHPDVNPDKVFAEKKTREILKAYEALSEAECGVGVRPQQSSRWGQTPPDRRDIPVPQPDRNAGSDPTNGDISSFNFVTFTLNQQRFALPVNEVREVLRLKDIRVVNPQRSSYLQGGIYWREQLIPLWDLRRRLKLGEESRCQRRDSPQKTEVRSKMSEDREAMDHGRWTMDKEEKTERENALEQVLVVSLDGQRVGLLVESVLEVVNLKESRIELSSKKTYFGSTYLKGIAKFKEWDLGLLNLEEILRDSRVM
ncbi:MAG: hypothetical protein COS84_00470 [Armatimonadetes bacterium CG07_land_8_20_14_0_80_40_9]|nr:MAG: hypothetical protein COS84_00470 [Armatimonadetes bacterium CG07_land_8_20_14_0_80_40_9]